MQIITGIITLLLLGIVNYVPKIKLLMATRFFSFGGELEIIILTIYSIFLYNFLMNRKRSFWRRLMWNLFSLLFYTQFILGILGFTTFLQTGKLHIPFPAMMIAAPVYRGDVSLMFFIFGASILLVGPAWCSYLCYFGVIDNYFADRAKPSLKITVINNMLRVAILLLMILIPLLYRYFKVNIIVVLVSLTLFIAGSIGIMFFISRKKGIAFHCTSVCPIGFLANLLGKFSVFRITISDNCIKCGACSKVCRRGALSKENIANKSAGGSCSLCGDCIAACKSNAIDYTYVWNRHMSAKPVFTSLVVIMHVIFLAVARV